MLQTEMTVFKANGEINEAFDSVHQSPDEKISPFEKGRAI
jgi:hypothetical protein